MKHELRVGILRWSHMLREQMFGSPKEDSEEWLRDPLSHPAIEAMSMTQLADLPFDRRRAHSEEMRPSRP